jgi:DHA1 family bicyclomycin/chloramphenicol resistance-like MFS transporter
MMAYLAGSEVIVEDVYDYGTYFPFFFGAIAVILAINSLNNARLVERFGVANYVRRLSIIAITTSTIFVFVSFLNDGKPNFWLFTIALAAVVPIAQGLVPICNTAAMMPVPHVAGTASAIIATITTAGGAILGNIASSQFDGTVRPFAISLLVFIVLATILIYWGSARYDDDQHHT